VLAALLARPTSVLVASATAVVIGVFSLLRLPVSLLPTLERPRLVVVVEDSQRSREELVHSVVEPLERSFAAIRGVTGVRSEVDDGAARITVESEWQTDPDRLRIDAERRLSEVAGSGVERLRVVTVAGDRLPVIEVAVLSGRGGGGSDSLRTGFAERTLIPELGRLPGAGEVRRVGGARLRVVVEPLGAALAARGLSARDVVARLEQVGRTQPVGAVRDGGLLRPVVVHSRVSSLEALGALRIADSGVALREVARIGLSEEHDEGYYRLDGQDAVLVEVYRAPGANAVRLAREVRAAVAELRARAVPGVELRVVADGSREVLAALGELGLAAVVGLVLGTAVLRWFLGSWRPTLALTVVVPSSILAAFGAFLAWGISLDVVSLAGLALALGMLVDNAIVVLEAIESAAREGSGDPAGDPVVEGTRGVALALVASFLTTAAVFVPLLYLRGLARAFFGVQAFAIVSSLALSLALSLSLTPVLSRWLGARRRRGGEGRQPGRERYLAVLERALRRPWLVAGSVLALSVAVIAASLGALPRELVPAGPGATLRVDFALSPELAPEAVRDRARAIEQAVREAAGGDAAGDVLHRAWRTGDAHAGQAGAEGRVRAPWIVASHDAAAALAAVERRAGSVPGARVEAVIEPALLARGFVEAGARYEIDVSASTGERATRLAERVASALREGAGLRAEPLADSRRRSAYHLEWKPLALAGVGADRAGIAAEVADGLGGFFAGHLSPERAPAGELAPVETEILIEATVAPELGLLPVASDGGSRGLPLAAVASVELAERDPPWQRRDGRPSATLRLEADPIGLRPERLAAALSRLELDHDERWRLAGAGYELERSFGQLRLALALAVILVFLTVAALYESLTLPLAVMATVPVAAAGALGGLAVTGQSLNVMSFLGVILLVGIVVNNAIVLLHRLEDERGRGGGPPDDRGLVGATLAAARTRYRPIVMTSLTTLLGMAPLAVLSGTGAELRRALAVAVSGGVVTGTLASLLLVPALYVALRTPALRRLASSERPHE
jgi:HAE1 family hydrophobic/amphiphilic exporter-1